MAFLSLILVSKYISDVSMQPTRFKLLPFCCIGNTGQSLSFGKPWCCRGDILVIKVHS